MCKIEKKNRRKKIEKDTEHKKEKEEKLWAVVVAVFCLFFIVSKLLVPNFVVLVSCLLISGPSYHGLKMKTQKWRTRYQRLAANSITIQIKSNSIQLKSRAKYQFENKSL